MEYLDVLVTPKNSEPDLDIVFVHGLNPKGDFEHARKTWTHENGTFWPETLLPELLPTARVLLFAYNSSILSNASNVPIAGHAQSLLNDVKNNRLGAKEIHRPLIFVAYSLGGLLVKQALVEAKINERKYGCLKASTYSLVFFATPHAGGNKAGIADIASKLCSVLTGQPSNSLLAILEKDSLLNEISSDQFMHQIRDYEILAFYETRKMSVKVGKRSFTPQFTSMYIVDRNSAKFGSDPLPLDCNHSDICKYLGKEDRVWERVGPILKIMGDNARQTKVECDHHPQPLEVSEISQLIKLSDISENIRMKEHSKMMDWLLSVNFWGKQVDLFDRAQRGTGRWIFEDERFKSWLAGDPKLLWCQGDAGAGKTILSAIIIDHLSSKVKSKDIGIAWLYIDYREHDLQTMETLFANLLVQLFKQRGEISKSMAKSLGFNRERAKPTPTEYKSWLQEEIQKFGRTIVIIDALDELRTTDLCRQFINELQSMSPQIHLLVTSRSDRELPCLRGDSIEIEIKPRKEDVILYIECRLQNSQQLWDHIQSDPSLKELAIGMLTKANDRMFLKAELILNVLENLETAKEVKKALNSLPPTYDGCYEFTLKQIDLKDAVQRNLAFKVLAWLSHALGGLTVKALQEALSMQTGDDKVDEEKQIPVDDLISVCSGLVVTDTVNGTQNIRLLHETASRYLKNIRFANFPRGHEIILKACLTYLSLPEFSELCLFRTRAGERARRCPFYEYAAKYWSDHAIQGNLESTFRDSIVNFLESTQRHSADEFLSWDRPSAWGCGKGTPWTDWNRDSISRRDTPLHAAATYGLRTTMGYLIKNKGYETDRRNNFGETALHRAAQVGRIGTMEELIAHGADLGAKVQHHYLNEATPLILAVICLQIESVRVLFNHGVDVKSFDPKYMTCSLHLAASMDAKLTRLLLDFGALVDFPGKSPCFPETWPMTSLHFAVFYAHWFQGALNRVSLLLDRGANINAQSSVGNTVLHMAILAGHEDLACLLLQKGANISLQNKNGKSVVQLARERGYLHWIEEGVPKEISRKLPTGPSLHRAIWSKNYSVVRELLQAGHDIGEEDQERVTPWEYCIRSADIELAQILVDHMNEHKSFDHVGNAAFEIALNHMTAFDYTDQQSWEKTVQICDWLLPFRRMFDTNLEFAKTESPISNYKKTFLIWAAELGRISQVDFFLRCGSDVNAADTFGSTALNNAVSCSGNFDMVRLLIENGSNLKLKDHRGATPLIVAERTENIPIRDYIKAALLRQSQQT